MGLPALLEGFFKHEAGLDSLLWFVGHGVDLDLHDASVELSAVQFAERLTCVLLILVLDDSGALGAAETVPVDAAELESPDLGEDDLRG